MLKTQGRRIVSEMYAIPGCEPLSATEIRVLSLVAEGYTNNEIATITISSEGTIRSHVQNIRFKLRARSKEAAVAQGFRRGILS